MGTYYKNVESLIEKIDRGVWVELGVDRGEGSTRWFSDLAKIHANRFYGVDMDPDQIAKATENLAEGRTATLDTNGQIVVTSGTLPSHIELVTAKGEDFILNLKTTNPDTKVSLVYLDNFDWDYWLGREEEAFVAGVKKNYQDKMGVEMNNLNSQTTHMLQAIHIMSMMTDNSVIICDDTWWMPEEGIFSGKCSGAIPYILMNGYKVLHTAGYRQNSGVILGRFKE